uniref:C-type lectin domain-containing protein n=2 Tax=Parascaris univalens TaxID=6257 RepID=A0A915ASP4_PARUN
MRYKYSCTKSLKFLVLLFASTLSTVELHAPSNNEDGQSEGSIIKQKQVDDELFEEAMTSCHPGWSPFADDLSGTFTHCIKVFMTYRMTWQQAEESCTHFNGAHLISLKDAQNVLWMSNAVKSEARSQITAPWLERMYKRTPHLGWWIGLGQLCPNEDVKKMPEMRWTDGEIFNGDSRKKIGDFEIRIPKLDEWNKHYCISYHSERATIDNITVEYFNMSECNERKNFICKMPALSVEQSRAGFIFSAKEEDKSAELIAEKANDMSDEYPCGKDPLYCPLKDERSGMTMCYHLLARAHFWQQARHACEAEYDADLASIHSKRESDYIYRMAMMQPSVTGETKFWIGLHRRNAQRQYEWSDGTSLNYMEMRTVEENDDEGNEFGACNALKLNTSSRSLLSTALYDRLFIPTPPTKHDSVYSWVHQRCDNKRLAICQKSGFGSKSKSKISKKEKQKEEPSAWKCSDGFKLFRGMCYKVFGTKKDKGQTFMEAKKSCEDIESTLVSITDPYEQGFVLSMLRGLNNDAWIGMDMTSGRVRWMDAEPVQMTRFSPENRVIKIGNEKHVFQSAHIVGFSQDACVSLDATKMIGYWDLTFNISEVMLPVLSGQKKTLVSGQCNTKKLPFICEKYAEKTNEETNEKPCYTNGDVTYCFLSNDEDKTLNGHYTFAEGKQLCSTLPKNAAYSASENAYGQLAQADDLFEWSFLTSNAIQNGYEQFYMGVEFNETSGFVRTDGVRVRLAPWGDGEPNLKNGNCVVTKLDIEGPAWYMAPCTSTRQLVCRLTKEQPMAELEHEVLCPKGKENWILGETHCYYLVTNTTLISSGYKADHDCFKLYNADLASFETKQDFDRFKEHIIADKLAVSSAFIGLVKQSKDAFAWKDLSPVTFVKWDKGEPDDSLGRDNEECVQMKLKEDFAWQTVTCWQNRHFICSVPVVGKYLQDTKLQSSGEESSDDKIPELPSSGEKEVTKNDDKEGDNEKEDTDKKDAGEKETQKEDGISTSNLEHIKVQENQMDEDEKTTDNKQAAEEKTVENGGDPIATSSSYGGMPLGSIIGATVGVVFALAIAFAYVKRRIGTSRSRQQRIMQFDALQNEDEYAI